MPATSLAELVANPYAKKKYLLILQPYDLVAAATTTVYLSGEGFVTSPTDTPANTYFEPRLVEPFSFSRSMFREGKLGGQSVPAFGQIVLTNADGGLDAFATYAWDGRAVELKVGEDGATYSNYFTIFKGQTKSIEFDDLYLNLLIRDDQADFTPQIQTTLYAGTGGTEGSANLAGSPKPLCFGEAYNVTPTLVDSANSIYQVHDGQIEAINAVYDSGVVISSGDYTTDLANGRFTINVSTTGTITADVEGAKPGGTYLTKAGDIINEIVQTYGGLASGDVNATSISNLNTANASTIGFYINSQKSILSVLDEICNTVGAFYGFDRDGVFEVERVELATGAADAEFDKTTIIEIQRLASSVPNYRTRVGYKRNYTVFSDSDLSSSVTAANRDFMVRDQLFETVTSSGTLTAYPNSDEILVESLFAGSGAASTEATRLDAIYDSQRDFYRIKVKTQPYTLKLNDVVKITFNRYNLTSGKLFTVVSLIEDAAINEIELELWG